MEERLTAPLPLLDLDLDGKSLSEKSRKSIASTTGPFTTPGLTNDTQIVIQWQAAELLNRIDTSILVNKVPKLAGAFCEIERVPIIKSYMNMLLLLQEKGTDKQWITRIPYSQEDKEFLTDQVEPLIRVNKRYSFRVPYLYHYGLAKDPSNELGIDYMLLDFIDGRQMKMWTETFPAWDQKKQVLDQLADIYLEMFSKPVAYEDRLKLDSERLPHRGGRRELIYITDANNINGMQKDFDSFEIPPPMTASQYLHRLADEAIRGKLERLLAEDADEISRSLGTTMENRFSDLLTLLLMRSLIATQIVGKYNDSPFYVTHPDLHNRNIIIQGKMVAEEPVPQSRPRAFTSDVLQQARMAQRPVIRRKALTLNCGKKDKLKLVGIVDWDSAHPVPFQAAATYPKFLETLPGAEFPDLPDDHKAPDLSKEKEIFLGYLRKKEVAATGTNMVSDLINKGSWERDFFTVALRRGDVRLKWVSWYKAQQTRKLSKSPCVQTELSLQDIAGMLNSLAHFLADFGNREAVAGWNGWPLINRVVVELEHLRTEATELCWVPNRKTWPKITTSQLSQVVTASPVSQKISEWERRVSGQSDAVIQGCEKVRKHEHLDNYLKFVLDEEQYGEQTRMVSEEIDSQLL